MLPHEAHMYTPLVKLSGSPKLVFKFGAGAKKPTLTKFVVLSSAPCHPLIKKTGQETNERKSRLSDHLAFKIMVSLSRGDAQHRWT